MVHPLMHESVWYNKFRFDDAEKMYQESIAKGTNSRQSVGNQSSLVAEIARARQFITQTLADAGNDSSPRVDSAMVDRIRELELENQEIKKVTKDIRKILLDLQSQVQMLSEHTSSRAVAPTAPSKGSEKKTVQKIEDDDDDDEEVDLFGSDGDDEEKDRIREERVKKYAEKKSKKPAVVAKSNIILDVKPWDDETDMKKLEECVRSLGTDGLLWGASKFVEVGYGIKKLQISCVVEDDKVGVDWLEEEIGKFEDYIQSVDIAAFNKV